MRIRGRFRAAIEATVSVSSSRCDEEIRNYVRVRNSDDPAAGDGRVQKYYSGTNNGRIPFCQTTPTAPAIHSGRRKTNDNAGNRAGSNKKSRPNPDSFCERHVARVYPGIKLEFILNPHTRRVKLKSLLAPTAAEMHRDASWITP